jgi:hypothetical protein
VDDCLGRVAEREVEVEEHRADDHGAPRARPQAAHRLIQVPAKMTGFTVW